MPAIRTKSPDLGSFAWGVRNDFVDKSAVLDIAEDQVFAISASGSIIALAEAGSFTLSDVLAAMNQESASPLSITCFTNKHFGQLGWGTASPIQLTNGKSEVFRIKGHGTFGFVLWNPKTVWRAVGGISDRLAASDLQSRCKTIIIANLQQELQQALEAGLVKGDSLPAIPENVMNQIRAKIKTEMRQLGLDLIQFDVVNLSVE